jgi:tetratricopeptide (TPR) repeat protein
MLRGRPFIFAVNADAMGKSIQGAGGALVLGAVLESLVERTKYSEQDRELLPEKWLKLAFIECHRVFESFDGSMLVSLIMSLIDEETGFTYFINAEHPLPVLIRNGQASFVEQGTVLRKLGMTGMSGFISIQTLSLEPGDVLIFGSDGKDDLILGEKDGMRLINEDERLFLKIAEEAQGDPSRMTEILSSRYELMDDLSLLSIQYRPDSENLRRRRAISRQLKEDIEAVRSGAIEPQRGIQLLLKGLSEYPENIHLHKQLASLYLKIGQYGRAIIHMEKYLRFRPEDDEMLFRLFLLMKKRNLLARAAEYGEVYHLRHPDDPRVVRELVEVYARLNNKVREEKFLRRLEAMQMMQDST